MKANVFRLAACLLLVGGSVAGSGEAKPNILLILADDLGYRDLGVQGSRDIRTPNIDRVFESGVRFTNGYVTCSVCAASRAGLLTGRFGSSIGVEGNIDHDLATKPGSAVGMTAGVKTIADHLKPAGYRNYCIGKWHLGYNRELFHPNERGFDEFFGLMKGSRSYFKNTWGKHNHLQHNGKYVNEDAADFYVTDVLTDKAIEYIRDCNGRKQPFFIYLSYTAPHSPHEPKAEVEARLRHIENEARRKYAGLVVNMDDNVGRVVECLNELKIMENTMIVFLSDNGGQTRYPGPSNGRLNGGKGSLMEGGIRVPFAIQWEGRISAGQVSDTPVISVDLLPTFLAVSGANRLGEIKTDGVNLMPLLARKVPDLGTRSLFWRKNFNPNKALRMGKYKYYREGDSGRESLYNLDDDLSEKKNLKNELPEVLATMRKKYAAWEAGLPPRMVGFGAPNPDAKKSP